VPDGSTAGGVAAELAARKTRPIGSARRNSPRRALFFRPLVSRARRTCSSASLMVPLRPKSRRSLRMASSSPFNGAVIFRPRKQFFDSNLPTGQQELQWSRDLSTTETPGLRPPAAASANFNGAVIFRPRKPAFFSAGDMRAQRTSMEP
jgi:hypothetical protein